MSSAASPVILALDVPDEQQALHWVKTLSGEIGIFKIGMQLFYAHGPSIVRKIQDLGGDIFLDLKLHDIPNTVAHACESILPLQVKFLTLHISGGLPMLEAAQAVVAGSRTHLLGITALTSLNDEILKAVYPDMHSSPSQWAVYLAGLAKQSRIHGIVCSAQETALMRQQYGDSLCLVNPGIRPAGSIKGDQKRVLTPQEAMQAGADYLVIGRPILESTDPLGTVRKIHEEIGHAAGLSA